MRDLGSGLESLCDLEVPRRQLHSHLDVHVRVSFSVKAAKSQIFGWFAFAQRAEMYKSSPPVSGSQGASGGVSPAVGSPRSPHTRGASYPREPTAAARGWAAHAATHTHDARPRAGRKTEVVPPVDRPPSGRHTLGGGRSGPPTRSTLPLACRPGGRSTTPPPAHDTQIPD